MNDADLRQVLERIQALISADTGTRLGAQTEGALAKILRDVASGNVSGAQGFASSEMTILLADLRGFTSISASHSPATVLQLINRCLITMSEVVFRHQGAIDKFMGDSIMVLFSGPQSADDPVRRAVLCGVDLQLAMDELNEHYRQFGLPELYLGVGINTGSVLSGTLGSNLYAAYTVIGDDVNLASRIEGFSLRGQVLISERTFERCHDFVTTGEPFSVNIKGKTGPITLREVLEIPSLKKGVPRREIRKSPRVRVRMPFSYRLVKTDVAIPQVHRGTILDMGYHGILAEIDQPSTSLMELRLEIDLALVGYKAADIHARIVKIAKSDGGGHLCGIEFTFLSADDAQNIRLFVQLMMQGSEAS